LALTGRMNRAKMSIVRDRALLNLLIVEHRRRRGRHCRVGERCRHASLNHSQRVAERLAGFHLIRCRPALELHEMHAERLRHRRAQFPGLGLGQHLVDEVVAHAFHPVDLQLLLVSNVTR
jgi:hypothetical protein